MLDPSIRLRLAAAGALSLLCSPALAQKTTAPAGPEGAYMSAAELRAKVATIPPAPAPATFDAPSSPGVRLMMIRRDKDGEVEVHDEMNDQIVMMEGRATMQVGGAVSGNRATGPGEWRGGTQVGGKTYTLGPGDVLWIPAGSPHQIRPLPGQSVSYLTFKDNHKPTAP